MEVEYFKDRTKEISYFRHFIEIVTTFLQHNVLLAQCIVYHVSKNGYLFEL